MSQATLGSAPYRNSSLFSGYYLDERVADRDAWDCDEEAEAVFEELKQLWQSERALVDGYNEDTLLGSWVNEVLDALGYDAMQETTLPDSNGYVDRLLFDSAENRRDAAMLKQQGQISGTFGQASALLEAKQWGASFTETFSEQRQYRDASHQVKYYLERTPDSLKWGVLTNGKKWRLYGTKDYETQTYYEVDLPELLESDSLESFKYFYVFFRPEAFREVSGSSFLEDVWNESETAAQELGEDLQDNVFTALRILGEGFVETNDLEIDPDDEEAREQVKEQSLVLLYRLMFILYAESRDLISPDGPADRAEFEENFSLDQLRRDIHKEISSGSSFDDFSEYSTSMWGRLEDLFRLVDSGEKSLGIPPYNGGLFDRESHSFLANHEVSNRYVAEVVYRLGTTRADDGDGFVLADYADLDTRHLGTIYEGLLEHEFRIASDEYAAVAEDGGQVWKPATEVSVADAVEAVEKGELYVVNDDGERKATGAYYTPDYVVTYIVEETINPLVEEIEEDLEDRELEPGTQEYVFRLADEILDLTVLDPAMGSGHFLTKATGYLAERVMERAREVEETAGVLDEQDIRRRVSRECIFGVDVNGMAVELAKLSMWLETLAEEKPLAFLDHHLKDGNSLVGSDITEVLSEDDPDDADGQITLFEAVARARERTLRHVMELMSDLLSIDNENYEDIKSMEELYGEIREDPLYGRLFELANVHTAEQYGLEVPPDVYETMAGAIDEQAAWEDVRENEWFRSAQNMAEEENFFHWELEYPQVFFTENGEKRGDAGFDAVIGNPPWVSNWELQESAGSLMHGIESQYSDVATGHWDLFVPFTKRAISLVSPGGYHSFILPNTVATEKYATDLREHIVEDLDLLQLLTFGEEQVFRGVDRQTMVYVLGRSNTSKKTDIVRMSNKQASFDYSISQDEFLKYYNNSFRIDLTSTDLKIREKMTEGSFELGQLCFVNPGVVAHSAKDSPKDFKKNDVISDEPHDGWRKYVSGSNIGRHEVRWENKYMNYDSNEEHFHRPKFPEMFESTKLMFSGISGAGGSLKICYDDKGYFTNHNVTHAVQWSPEIEKHRGSMNYESMDDAEDYDLKFAAGVVGSTLMSYYFKNFLATGTLQGSYTGVYPENIRQLPIQAVDTDDDTVTEATFQKHLSNVVEGATDPEFVVSLIKQEEGSEMYHHSIAEATSKLMELKENRNELNLTVLDYLGNYQEGISLSDIGLTQPPEDAAESMLQQTTEQRPNLRVGEVKINRESTTTVEIRLTARYKPEEEDEYETDQWGYTETEPLSALRVTDLTETEADLIEAFVPVAVAKAGGFANFRETATKTNSLVDRLRKLTLPRVADVRDGLEDYLKTMERAEKIEKMIGRTDGLIDEMVYELYSLTDEEIDTVEENVGK